MVDWARSSIPPNTSPFVLDIGAGNGTLSIALVEAGYDPSRILGIDYSADSVRLARSVASHRSASGITFEPCDFLSDNPPTLSGMPGPEQSWDLLLDKGTFDAIALASKSDGSEVSPTDMYPGRVSRLLKAGGYFLITSCNFTEEELKHRFETSVTSLAYHSRIQYKMFTFGGKTGSVCSSVAFVKK